MNKDTHIIFEAYKKKIVESNLPRLSPAPIIGKEKEVKYTHSKDPSEPSSSYVTYILNGTGKYVYFYYDTKGNFERGLIKGNDGTGMNLQTFRKEDIEKIASEIRLDPKIFLDAIEEGSKKIKSAHPTTEDAEESSSKELTTNDVHHLIDHLFTTASKSSLHYPKIKGIYTGQIYEVLREMGHEYFNKYTQEAVNAYEAHCMQVDESFDHAHSDKDRITITHAQDPETDILWYNWSGDSHYSKAATESAIRLADKHGFNKVVINPQG